MKKIKLFYFAVLLLISTNSFAQIPFPHNANNSAGAERISNFGVNGVANQRFEITNATVNNGQFLPALWAHNGSTNYHSLQIHATTTSAFDNGSSPLMMFIASRPTTINLNAPNSTQFPWGNGGTQQTVNNRPTFSWINGSNTVMLLSAQNNLGLNTASPTARLDVNGAARVRVLPITTSDLYVLTSDGNGNIRRQLKSSLGGGANNCNSTNFIVKQTSAGLNCSQIYDNGKNVGIGTTNPGNKLTVNGNIQSLSSTFLSDEKYKKNIKTIDNALQSVLKLTGTTYNWKKEEFKEIEFTENLQYGLIAQEVHKVIPELVNISNDNDYSLNYNGLIPVLIEAIKEQQNQITELNNKISDITSKNKDIENVLSDGRTYFSGNYPNPFEVETKIDLFIDKNVKEAIIVIYDSNGSTITKYNIKERNAKTNIVIPKSNLNSGVYFYTLITDNIVIGTKKMIVK